MSYSPRPHVRNNSPSEEGWNLEDGKYVIDWFDGEATPQLLDVVRAEDQNIDDSDKIAQDEADDIEEWEEDEDEEVQEDDVNDQGE